MDEYILAVQEQLDKTEAQIRELLDANTRWVNEINNNPTMPEPEKKC